VPCHTLPSGGSDEADSAARVEIRLLGPLELVVAGRDVHIGSPKQRAVLALLALQPGTVVSADQLVDLVWDGTQPAAPSATLHTLVSRLRASLGRDVLPTREPGWMLDVDAAAVDALRFGQLTARARRRRERGETAAAAADLADALELWRGRALADVVDAGYLEAHATRLNEARLDAVEDLADAELNIGRASDALVRLEDHVDANPLRERGWGLLMQALYRLGRQAAALRAFQQVRTMLREELGIEPSPELVQIEQQILAHDAALAGPSRPSVADVPAGEFADFSVMVVEDHDFQRRTVVQLLRGLGVGTVTDAADGEAALKLLESDAVPDIVICDIDMPGLDGVEFVTRIAASNLACAVVIASGLESNVVHAVEAIGESHGVHVLAALEKPLSARRLGDVLRQYTRLTEERTDAAEAAAVNGDELRAAFERGEIAAHFRPRIDLSTGSMSSVETRAGWSRPDGWRVLGAGLRRALAREGLLWAFLEGVVASACSLIEEAGYAGVNRWASLRATVNVSQLQLSDPSVADRLAELAKRGVQEPRRFVWEVDDVVLARAPAEVLAVLTRLRVKGFGLAMRHTGTGPAWTNQLERAPLTELSLDRRLVAGAGSNAKRSAMLESTLAAARDAGLRVVADGCDSQADFDMLLELGSPEAEGRFIADAMAPSDLVAWALHGYLPAGGT
jgi:DNA-binding SARP family transcriptional activator/EAL domain-containing protein (putative c-di-GMP-specific phosphodiesterase class I)